MSNSTSSHKRLRKGCSSPIDLTGSDEMIDVSALRADLARRSSDKAIPSFLTNVASLCGTRSMDALMCSIGQSVAAAIRSVQTSAEASHERLRSLRATLHDAIDVRCDKLEVELYGATSAKTAALERELAAVDTALDAWRSETGHVTTAIAKLSDADLMARHANLKKRLDGLELQLRALPTLVEPPRVNLIVSSSTLLDNIARFGRVDISGSHVALERVPTRVPPGQTCNVHMTISGRRADRPTAALDMQLGAHDTPVLCSVIYPGHDTSAYVASKLAACSEQLVILVEAPAVKLRSRVIIRVTSCPTVDMSSHGIFIGPQLLADF